MEEQKKVVMAYTVKAYEDGSVDVQDANLENVEHCNSEDIYKDIERVAKLIENKRLENSVYYAMYRFYADIEKRSKEAEAEDKIEDKDEQ